MFCDLELATTINRRISESVVVEVTPLIGFITQLYLFEGNEDRYKIQYGGGTVGLNFGRRNKSLEITLGAAYFRSSNNSWGQSSNRFLPVCTIGHKVVGKNSTFRIGLGFPHGFYIGVNF